MPLAPRLPTPEPGAVGRRARCAALASVSLSGRAAPPAPAGGGAPLFSLAMAAPRRGVASSELSGGAAGSSEASDDTGSSSEDDTTATEAELQFLQRWGWRMGGVMRRRGLSFESGGWRGHRRPRRRLRFLQRWGEA